MQQFQKVNSTSYQSTSGTCLRSLWTQFFDNDVSLEVKRRMVGKLQGENDKEELAKRPQYQAFFFKDKQLDDFITPKKISSSISFVLTPAF